MKIHGYLLFTTFILDKYQLRIWSSIICIFKNILLEQIL